MSKRFTSLIRLFVAIAALLLSSRLLPALTNSDVISLHKAGISTDTILLAINSAEEQAFDVSAAALVALKEAGVDESVIQAILLTSGETPVEKPVEQVASPPVVEEKLPAPPEAVVAVRVNQKTSPKPLFRPTPVYPQELKEKGISGSVSVRFTVNPVGDVKDIVILESDHELFATAAREALAGWKFEPATLDGVPVESDVKLSIPFNIADQASSLNRPPKPLYNPKPNYPRTLRDEGVTGYVKVQVVVDVTGEVQDIEVVASDNELFSEEAVKVLKKWKFAPALENGQPISSRVQFSIPFKIRD